VSAKTNAMRALEAAGVAYEAASYEPALTSAEEVAHALGVPPSEIYKTLVMVREGDEKLLVMVPGDKEVSPKVLARSLGARSVAMVSKREAERLTGLQTGGIGALALLGRRFTVLIDRDALGREHIYVNGGRRGLNLRVPVAGLMRLTGARAVQVAPEQD
jgi:Cys-tRNA(Pro)/Cys-tRNA(Cys) deacylase